MSKVKRIKYFTEEKKKLISEENKELYDKYLRVNISKNRDVKNTTYKVYENNMTHFMIFLAERYNNIGLYSEEFFEDAIDIIEDYIIFLQEELENNKKTINNKLSAVSSFYVWSRKRKLIKSHPFDGVLERMKNAKEEKIIASHYLTSEEVDIITEGLKDESKYDIQDRIIWGVMVQSCNRVGAIARLTLSSLNLEDLMFEDIREKRSKIVEVSFECDTKEIIKEWLEKRKELDKLSIDSLLITKYGGVYQPMAKNTIQSRIKRIGEIIGLDDFRSHSVRKTAINNVYLETGSLELAAEMGNHESTDTTKQAYIKPKSKADVKKQIKELKEQNRK